MSQSNTLKKRARHLRRKRHIRRQVRGTPERPRVSVYRSAAHIYAQVIDDEAGKTLCSASTLDKDLRDALKSGGNRDAAQVVGKTLALRAKETGVGRVVFDRNGFRYCGRVQALACALREGGLEF